MEVFRITLKEFSDKLFAPVFKGRWNDEGQFVIYSASSRSLASLENLVHRNEIPADLIFATMVIYVPDELPVETVNLNDLPADWLESKSEPCPPCLEIGSSWYNSKKYPILRVPSAVIPYEWNYVINSRHKGFEQISLVREEPFYFDERLKVTESEVSIKLRKVDHCNRKSSSTRMWQ